MAILPVTVAAVAAVGAMQVPSQVVPDEVEACVADMAGVADCTTVGGRSAEEHLSHRNRELSRAAVEWIMRAKLHFGELKDTAADRICAKRWLAEEMKKADMRDKDACGLIPVVVEMLFVPTADDVFASKIKRSRVARTMKLLAETPSA